MTPVHSECKALAMVNSISKWNLQLLGFGQLGLAFFGPQGHVNKSQGQTLYTFLSTAIIHSYRPGLLLYRSDYR